MLLGNISIPIFEKHIDTPLLYFMITSFKVLLEVPVKMMLRFFLSKLGEQCELHWTLHTAQKVIVRDTYEGKEKSSRNQQKCVFHTFVCKATGRSRCS